MVSKSEADVSSAKGVESSQERHETAQTQLVHHASGLENTRIATLIVIFQMMTAEEKIAL